MTALINRPEYLKQLTQNKNVDLVKAITGIQRCWKSALLDLFHQCLLKNGTIEENVIHMNLESLRYLDLTDYLSFYDYVGKSISKVGKTVDKYIDMLRNCFIFHLVQRHDVKAKRLLKTLENGPYHRHGLSKSFTRLS